MNQFAQKLMTVEQFNSKLKQVLAGNGVVQAQVDRVELVDKCGTQITIVNGIFQAPNQGTQGGNE